MRSKIKTQGIVTLMLIVIFLALIGLKLFKVVYLPYWIVFMPVYAPVLISMAWVLISFGIGSMYVLFTKKK